MSSPGMQDFRQMNVYNLRSFLISRGITVSNLNKDDLVKLAEAAATMGLPTNVEYHDDDFDLTERLTIKGIKLPNPFSIPRHEFSNIMQTVPPFGIEDIFNFLIFKSSDYDRQKVASYKAFEEYGLFEDGFVEDLRVKELLGHFIFIGQVKPTMKPKTKEGENFYKLWFFIDGDRDKTVKEGNCCWKPTAGSIFSAYCQCPGGQDGACKHIAATLYSLHDCLHPLVGPTDKLCYWRKKDTRNTDPSPISEVVVKKSTNLLKSHGFKKRERIGEQNEIRKKKKKVFRDNLNFDPRAQSDKTCHSLDKLREIKEKLKHFSCVSAAFVISEDEDEGDNSEILNTETFEEPKPIIFEKAENYLKFGSNDKETFVQQLTISNDELRNIENITRTQSHSQMWKIHRRGLITSTKLCAVNSRQTTIERDATKSGETLARSIVDGNGLEKYSKLPVQIEYGRLHENEARREYRKLITSTHVNCTISSSGLLVNKDAPFLAASPDDIRSCKCCEMAVVEYKCPFKNREKHAREAFLDKSIGGVQQSNGSYKLKQNHKYYYQVQAAMAAANVKMCDFVVYTQNTEMNSDGSIFVVEIAFDPRFWKAAVEKASQFFLNWVVPLIFESISAQADGIYQYKEQESQFEQEDGMELEIQVEKDQSSKLDPEKIILDEHQSIQSSVVATIKGVPIFQED